MLEDILQIKLETRIIHQKLDKFKNDPRVIAFRKANTGMQGYNSRQEYIADVERCQQEAENLYTELIEEGENG